MTKQLHREIEDDSLRGGLTRDDLWKIYERVNIGDKIKYRASEGYFYVEGSSKIKKGTVIDKQANYCTVIDDLGIREGVLWLDVILNEVDK